MNNIYGLQYERDNDQFDDLTISPWMILDIDMNSSSGQPRWSLTK